MEDGKGIGDKNRLTNKQIYDLQEYYGLAIKKGDSDWQQMKKNIWAIYFHKISTDKEPQHNLCPKGADTWCGHNKAQANNETYKHKNSLPYVVLVTIKDIFKDLADPNL